MLRLPAFADHECQGCKALFVRPGLPHPSREDQEELAHGYWPSGKLLTGIHIAEYTDPLVFAGHQSSLQERQTPLDRHRCRFRRYQWDQRGSLQSQSVQGGHPRCGCYPGELCFSSSRSADAHHKCRPLLFSNCPESATPPISSLSVSPPS